MKCIGWLGPVALFACSDGGSDDKHGGDSDTDTDADTDADTDTDTTVPLPTVESPLRINEIVPSNLSGLQDSSLAYPDWVEIWNDSANEVSLADCYLTDEHDWSQKWAFPPSAVVPANGFVIVMCDGDVLDSSTGEFHTSFNLKVDGEWIALTVDMVEGGVGQIHGIEYPLMGTDVSWARMPDGGEFESDATPTPAAANE